MNGISVFGFNQDENISISKIACQYGWSASRLNSFLYKEGVIGYDDDTCTWHLTNKYKDKGYSVEGNFVSKNGYYEQSYLLWTHLGQELIYNLVKDKLNVTPKIDFDDDNPENVSFVEFSDILIDEKIVIDGYYPNDRVIVQVLQDKGYLNGKSGILKNTPQKRYEKTGYFKVFKEIVNGKLNYFTKITPSGQEFFIGYFKWLMAHNYKLGWMDDDMLRSYNNRITLERKEQRDALKAGGQ